MVDILLFTGLYTSQVVQDFFHQQYHTYNNLCVLLCAIKIHRPKQLKACFIASPSKIQNKLYPNNFSGLVSDKHPLASLVASSFFKQISGIITLPTQTMHYYFRAIPQIYHTFLAFFPPPKKTWSFNHLWIWNHPSKTLSRPSICFKRLHLKRRELVSHFGSLFN